MKNRIFSLSAGKVNIMSVAIKLKSYGFDVYLSKDGTGDYGFFTDGKRVVSFQSDGKISGNYSPCRFSGTGWIMAYSQWDITEKEALDYITQNAPIWTNNKNPIYSTPKSYLKLYGNSSKFSKI